MHITAPLVLCVVGVLISVLGMEAWIYENPARIPFGQFALRAAFGPTLYVLLSSIPSLLIYRELASRVEWLHLRLVAEGAAFVVGLVVPQVIWLKELVIQESIPERMRLPVRLLVRFSEATVLYPPKIISREERKINDRYCQDRYRPPIHRLYELCAPTIALKIAIEDARRGTGDDRVLTCLKTRDPDVRLKHMLRFFGSVSCMRFIEAVEKKLETVLPTWPPSRADLRRKTQRQSDATVRQENRVILGGRRRVDSQFLFDAYRTVR